jgi:hypothetical protein
MIKNLLDRLRCAVFDHDIPPQMWPVCRRCGQRVTRT